MKHMRLSNMAALAAAGMLIGLLGLAVPAAAEEYILKDGRWVAAPKPEKGTAAGELALIRQQLEAKQYKSARKAADAFRKAHPDSPACEEAMLLGAQAEIDRGMYYQAFERLQEMIARYPNGTFLERALNREMECAEAFLSGKKRIIGSILRLPAYDEGLTILRKVSEHAPGTDIAERALLRIGDYHLADKDYRDAVDAYDEFLALNPRSARVPGVSAKAASAMFDSFKGVAYDETPLVEAQNRYKALIEQYPDEARKARAADILREITTIRAERAYETAKFYERTHRPKSAQFYYRQIVDEFPATVWASEARSKVTPRKRTAPPKAKPTRASQAKAGPADKAATPTPAPAVKPVVKKPTPAKPTPVVKPTPAPAPTAKPKPAPAPTAKPKPAETPKAPTGKDPDDSLLERLLESQDQPTTKPAAKSASDESKGQSK